MALKSKERKSSSDVKQKHEQQPTSQKRPRGSLEGTIIRSFIGLQGNGNYQKVLQENLNKEDWIVAQYEQKIAWRSFLTEPSATNRENSSKITVVENGLTSIKIMG